MDRQTQSKVLYGEMKEDERTQYEGIWERQTIRTEMSIAGTIKDGWRLCRDEHTTPLDLLLLFFSHKCAINKEGAGFYSDCSL